jgi:hypothetical protein
MRERVERFTGRGTCGEACHARIINPFGFAFEHYGALGEYRTTDTGKPVNAADEAQLDNAVVRFRDALELGRLLADSDEAHRCYVRNWLEFAHGRSVDPVRDRALLDRLVATSRGGSASSKDLLLMLVDSPAFLFRR